MTDKSHTDTAAQTSQVRNATIEECAKAAEAQAQEFLSPKYAANQPFGSFCERFACDEVAKAIRALAAQPPAPPVETDCDTVKHMWGQVEKARAEGTFSSPHPQSSAGNAAAVHAILFRIQDTAENEEVIRLAKGAMRLVARPHFSSEPQTSWALVEEWRNHAVKHRAASCEDDCQAGTEEWLMHRESARIYSACADGLASALSRPNRGSGE